MFTNKDVVMDPSTTSATRLAPKGSFMWYTHPDNGQQLYRHGKAPSGGCTAGLLYAPDATSSDSELTTGTTAANLRRAKLYGVAQNAIAANEYGWFLVRGVGTGTAASNTADGAYVGAEGTAGKIGDASVSQEIGRCVAGAQVNADATGLFQFDLI